MIAERIAHHVPRVLPAAREIAIIGSLFLLYNWGRVLIRDQDQAAKVHSGQVHRLESALGLPSEAWLQHAVGVLPHIFEAANRYYTSVHFPLMILFLVWGFTMRPRAEYLWARRLLVLQTFLALAIHVAYPLAPPRMFPQWGFIDTGALWGPSPYQGASGAVANQFAAMPSLHIGWAVLIAVVVTRTGPRWLAGLACLHAAATVFVVVITANHWWLDGLVAVALLGIALALFPGPRKKEWADAPTFSGRTRLPVCR